MTLLDLKEYLNTLLITFSNVMDLEMTIINKDPLVRVAMTGNYYNHDKVLCEKDGSVKESFAKSYSLQVMETGQPLIRIHAADSLASPEYFMDKKERAYYSIIVYPICVRNVPEGVIVLASFNKRQQDLLIQKQEQLLKYSECLADLISSKMKEDYLIRHLQRINAQMNTVLEMIQDGLILYSENHGILHMNTCAKNYLHFDDKIVKEALIAEVISIAERSLKDSSSHLEVIHKTVDNTAFSIQVRTLIIPDTHSSVLCVINPYWQVVQSIAEKETTSDVSQEIIYSGNTVRELVNKAITAASNPFNVLISGESGTGKELMARLIHARSNRKDKPFIAINCAAIPETLLESELFGYEEGAFTGAKKGGKIGKFLMANHGTLFLDEVGELPLYMQAKLLRVLSERKIDPIGGSYPIDIDVRIISATNRNLEEMIDSKEFREDLYYRLSVVPLHTPPLRKRKEDIFILSKYFIDKYNRILNKNIRGIEDDTLKMMRSYDWPGNIRELENSIEYMMTFEKGTLLSLDNVPHRILAAVESGKTVSAAEAEICQPLKQSVEAYERSIIMKLNEQYGGSPSREEIRSICEILKISVASYYRKLNGKKDTEHQQL